MATAITPYNPIEEFKNLLGDMMANCLKMCEVYVEAIDTDPAWRHKFAAEFPNFAWRNVEEVGRGSMHPDLLLIPNQSAVPAIRRLPVSVQAEITGGSKYPLVISGGDNIKVDVRLTTKSQRDQLLADDHIRTVAEQKAWLLTEAPDVEEKPARTLPYKIVNHRVRFMEDTIVDKGQLQRILMEL